MQRVEGPGESGAPGRSGGVDEDMADGDLGDGTRTKPRTDPRMERSSSCSGLNAQEGSRRGSEQGWSPRPPWSQSPLQNIFRSGCLEEMSKAELRNTLQKATETIELLQTELEVTHRYLEGKYAALKILQGQAILEKATSHTKNVLQKSEERAKALEKEVNTLQWELSLSQLRLRTSEQAFEKNFYRMLSERNSLSEALKQTEKEKEQLQAENRALSQQCMELLSSVNPQSIYTTTKGHKRREKDCSAPPEASGAEQTEPMKGGK